MNAGSSTPTSAQPTLRSGTPKGVVRIFGDIRFRVDGELSALCFTPDGTAWSIEEPGVLRQWSADSGLQLLRRELGDLENVWAFSPDAHVLASAGNEVSLWDMGDGRFLTALPQDSWVTTLAFAPNSRLLAAGNDDGIVTVWNLSSGKLKFKFTEHSGPISSVAFSPTGKRLASSSEDKTICIWDMDKGRLQGRLTGHTDRIDALAWHPDGRLLASAGWDTMARVWNTETYEPVILLNGHSDLVSCLAFSPDGKLLASADNDDVIWLWDHTAGKPIRLLTGHSGLVKHLAFRQDSLRLLSGGEDGKLLLWEVESGENLCDTGNQHHETARISVSHDGSRLASATGTAPVRIWETATGATALQITQSDQTLALAYSPDGKWLVTGDSSGAIYLWSPLDGTLKQSIEGHRTPITSLTFSPDSQLLASSGGTDGYVYLWSMTNFEPALLFPEAADGCTTEWVEFIPGTSLIAIGGVDWLSTGGTDGGICIWDIAKSEKAATFATGTMRLSIRPDGLQLASATLHESVCLWDVKSKSLLTELKGHEGPMLCVVYDPKGRMIATSAEDHYVRFWRADNGELISTIELDTLARHLRFSPDVRRLFTANTNTTCYMIEAPSAP